MTEVTINERVYRIEFRHITKLGNRRQLFDRAPVKAVTTCVVATDSFMAIDNAICANEDNFARRQGRINALKKVLKHCGALKDVSATLFDWYITTIDPPPAAVALHALLTNDQRQVLIDGGEQKRNERKAKQFNFMLPQ